ncbi:MAG TPA: YciI family protein [Candidatus Dormibacteraeota bacterium]|nr:YciI family protein [Candidatus Dormibacteraeota bacterium]
MRYLIMIYSNPQSRRVWENLTDEQRAEGAASYRGLNEELARTGEIVASEPLAGTSQAKRISTEGGHLLTTDGPFAEVKEHLAGFYLIECAGMERAVELASRVPEARLGLVEVRPVIDRSVYGI